MNLDKNATDVVKRIIDIFTVHIKNMFNIDCCRDDIILLESSNHVKVSYHLIFKGDNHFKSKIKSLPHLKVFISPPPHPTNPFFSDYVCTFYFQMNISLRL